MENQNVDKENKVVSNYITIDDFAKVEIKLGTIIEAREVEGSDKLYQLTVDFGEIQNELVDGQSVARYRNVMSGIRKYRSIEELVGRQFPFVTNLAPRKMMSVYMSEAMILAGSDDNNFTLLPTENKLVNGTRLR